MLYPSFHNVNKEYTGSCSLKENLWMVFYCLLLDKIFISKIMDNDCAGMENDGYPNSH